MSDVEGTLMRLRQVIAETGVSLCAAARGCGLHQNSFNRVWDDTWRPRTDTMIKIERWLDHADGPKPLSQLPLSGEGWWIVRDADGWFILFDDDPTEPYAVGPYNRLRDAVAAATSDEDAKE